MLSFFEIERAEIERKRRVRSADYESKEHTNKDEDRRQPIAVDPCSPFQEPRLSRISSAPFRLCRFAAQ